MISCTEAICGHHSFVQVKVMSSVAVFNPLKWVLICQILNNSTTIPQKCEEFGYIL